MITFRVPRRAVQRLFRIATTATIVILAVIAALWPKPPPRMPRTFPTHYAVFEPELIPAPHVPLEATAYCSCPICCGRWSDGWTASGTRATAGRTLAADPTWFPFGACLAIEDLGRRFVEDTGSAIVDGRIDVYFEDHREALEFGRQFVSWSDC